MSTLSNPFVPYSSVISYSSGVFEMRLHVHGVPSDVQLVGHDKYILVTGRVTPRTYIDAQGLASTLLWSDSPCGYFGREIPLNLKASTEVLILEKRQEANDLVIRYTLRPKATAYSCGPSARVDQFSARPDAQPVYNDAFATSLCSDYKYEIGAACSCPCCSQQVTQTPYALSNGAPPQVVTAESAGVSAGASAHLGNVKAGAKIGASEGIVLKEGVPTAI